MKDEQRAIPRADGRHWNVLRPVSIQRRFTRHAEGSVFIEIGRTRVLCTASVEPRVPDFLEGSGRGWITAEYAMLPRATTTRTARGTSARAYEIQRLIGRALRAVTDLSHLGPRTLRIDCDVIEADGGTRTAAITGSFIALHDALEGLIRSNEVPAMPIIQSVAATSVGIVNGYPMLDLCYDEDSRADVDLNVVMSSEGDLIEVQGTAERPFERSVLDELLDLAQQGIKQLIECQKQALASDSSS